MKDNFIISLLNSISFFPFVLLIFCGVFLSVRGRFFQLRLLPRSACLMKKAFRESKKRDGVTSFKAACTSLSAAVGTGNIAGVAAAISIGGAGAVFWMWVSAILGMAIKAAEITLGIYYRKKETGDFFGGPMYYIKYGLSENLKPLAFLFAIVGIPAVFCTGNITQTNAAVISITDNRTIRLILGLVFAFLTYISVSGGINRIAEVTEKIVPSMSVIYIIICLIVIILNIDFLPQAFKMIIVGAFKPRAVTSGAVGSFLTTALIGSSRGIFSNEAGIGTGAIAHSAAVDANPQNQGLFGIFEVFVDTLLICTLTAVTILCSKVPIEYGTVASSKLASAAISAVFGDSSDIIISIMLCLFAFSSIIGWAAYGSIFSHFLKGDKFRKIFEMVYPFFCIIGAVADVGFVWKLSDFFSGIMLCINLPSIIMLSDKALKYFKKEEIGNVQKTNRKNSGNFRR